MDREGKTQNSYRYDEYDVLEKSREELPFSFGFTGYKKEKAENPYFANAREYNGISGSFLTKDQGFYIDYRNPNTLNLYQYVQGNPLRYVDYDGHECIYEKSYLDRSLEMVVLGNYSDEFTLLGLGMQISLGLTGLDAAGDIRDLTTDFTVNFDPKSPEWWKIAAIDTIAIFPLIGIVKHADELGAGMKALMKKAADLFTGGKKTAKVIDVLGNISRKGRAKTEDIARAVNKLVDGAKKRLHDIRNVGRVGEAAGDAAKNLDDLLGGGLNSGRVLSNGQSLDDMAKLYAEKVNSNNKWSWMDDFPDAGELSKADKADIRNLAIEKGLIPDVPVNVVTDASGKTYRYADFDAVGLVKEKVDLPEHLWSENDAVQFKWLDDKIGGRPEGYTWHHSEIDGQMELVPTGIHNVYNHNGGRTINHWAYREGGR